jgi:hypothetical protein
VQACQLREIQDELARLKMLHAANQAQREEIWRCRQLAAAASVQRDPTAPLQ